MTVEIVERMKTQGRLRQVADRLRVLASDDARRMSLLKREINGDFSQIYGSFLERVVGREVTL